jgi:hypothetical protein
MRKTVLITLVLTGLILGADHFTSHQSAVVCKSVLNPDGESVWSCSPLTPTNDERH